MINYICLFPFPLTKNYITHPNKTKVHKINKCHMRPKKILSNTN